MAEDIDFKLRYVGGRFHDAKLPLEVLSDLPAFRDLIVAFARELWFDINTGRQRVPKGFDTSLSFDLVGIEAGSAVPKLSWSRDVAQAQLPGLTDSLSDIVEVSFLQTANLFDEAGNDRFPKALSSEHVRALNKLGAGLRDDERIEFLGSKGADGNVVFLDAFRRKQLITRVRETYRTRFEGIGELLGSHVDAEGRNGHIRVLTDKYGEITMVVDEERVRGEFDGNIKSQVQFDLQIELDNQSAFRGVTEVFHVGIIDNEISDQLNRRSERIAEIARLGAGWKDGEGAEIADAAVVAARRLLTKRPGASGYFKIYPTEEGGILFEFQRGGWDLAVEFGVDGVLEMYGVEIDGKGELEPTRYDAVDDDFLKDFDSRMGR